MLFLQCKGDDPTETLYMYHLIKMTINPIMFHKFTSTILVKSGTFFVYIKLDWTWLNQTSSIC